MGGWVRIDVIRMDTVVDAAAREKWWRWWPRWTFLSMSFLISGGGFDVPPIPTYFFVWPLESQGLNYIPQQFANLSQSDRIASYRGAVLAQCCRIDSSPHRMLGIPMKTQQYGAPQLINIESRFVSKVLPEHFLGEFYSPRARLEVRRNCSRMIQKVCAVFDLCGLGLVFDGSKRAASFCEVYVILTAHCPWSETSSCEWCQCHCAIEEYVCELWSLLFPVQSILCRFCGSWVARISLERT